MATKYTKEIKDKVLQLLSEGISVTEIFFLTKVSTTTIYRWQRETLDNYREPNATIIEVQELKNEITELRETIKILEDELEDLRIDPKPQQLLTETQQEMLAWLDKNFDGLSEALLYISRKMKADAKAKEREYMETGEVSEPHPLFNKHN